MRRLEAGNQCRRGAGGAIALADKLVSAPYQKFTPCLLKRTVSDFSGGAGTLDATVDRSGRLAEKCVAYLQKFGSPCVPFRLCWLIHVTLQVFWCVLHELRETRINRHVFVFSREKRQTDIFVWC